MKKLMVLLMVFGITSMAGAGVIDVQISSLNNEPIDPVDYIEIVESDWVNLDIYYIPDGSEYIGQISCELTTAGIGTMDMTDLTFPEGAWDMDETWSPGITEVTAGKVYTLTYSEGMTGSGSAGILVDHILVHCDGFPGDITVSITADVLYGGIGTMDNNWRTIGSGLEYGPGVTIHNIPEPMTIALLGLGGLFLIRRRK